MDPMKKDDRFAHIAKDPRFRNMKKSERKVTIDKRFEGMFNDKSFKLKYTVDKRGRPINATTNEDLKRFYELGSDASDSESEEESTKLNKKEKKEKKKSNKPDKNKSDKSKKGLSKTPVIDDDQDQRFSKITSLKAQPVKTKNEKTKVIDDQSEDDDEEVDDVSNTDSSENDVEEEHVNSSDSEDSDGEQIRFDIKSGPDYARGEGNISSSSESEDDDEEEVEEEEDDDDDDNAKPDTSENETDGSEPDSEDDVEHNWGEVDHDAKRTEETTCRLAVCNMDWDRIKAQDMLMLFNSFKPTGTMIKSVKIYLSDYGEQRMKEEDKKGPPELTMGKKRTQKEKKEGATYQQEQLRVYQLNRLRYYYAIVECDNATTAGQIYDQCDGIEYESSAAKIDLRFVPDDMTFDRTPTSEASEVLDSTTYKPSLFATSALQQSKVNLTWDETNPERTKLTMRTFKDADIENMDMKNYLASDSDGGDDYAEDPYKGLEDPDVDEEFDDEEQQIQKMKDVLKALKPDQDDKDVDMEITWEPGLIQQASEKSKEEQLTPWEKYLDKKEKKRKEKKVNRKQNQDQQQGSDSGLDSNDDLPDGIDMNDPYFKQELDNVQTSATGSKRSEKRKRKNKPPKLTASELQIKQQKEAELQLMLMDEDDQKQHFSLKAIQQKEEMQDSKKKKKRKRQMKKANDNAENQVADTFTLNVQDNRFTDLYSNPLYNMDPSAPEFKKTKASEALIDEKIKRRLDHGKMKDKAEKRGLGAAAAAAASVPAEKRTKTSTKDANLASLVKSVKTKTRLLGKKKKR